MSKLINYKGWVEAFHYHPRTVRLSVCGQSLVSLLGCVAVLRDEISWYDTTWKASYLNRTLE